MRALSIPLFGLALLGFAAPGSAQAPADIGVAATVVNQVEGTVGQQTAAKRTGDKVFQDERIRTGRSSKGQLLFRDETALTVGPDSEVTLDRFVYDPARGAAKVTLNATRGVFRFISGSLPSQAYEIRTPAGTIGVRGTIVEMILAPDGTAVFRNVEGSFVLETLSGSYALDRPGQVITVRPGGRPEVTGSLTRWQEAALLPIREALRRDGTVPQLPEGGGARPDELRSILRGRIDYNTNPRGETSGGTTGGGYTGGVTGGITGGTTGGITGGTTGGITGGGYTGGTTGGGYL